MKDVNFLIVGVGGQGTILLSDILAEAGMEAGLDAKKSDILGLAVRGGSVCSHVRWGTKVGAPMSMPGTVDYLIACEPLEALRMLEYLKPDSSIVCNDYRMPPMLVSTGEAEYPPEETIFGRLADASSRLIHYDATEAAYALGNAKTMNVMLLGTLAALLGIDAGIWERAVRKHVPSKHVDVNIKAFQMGRDRAT